MQVRRLSVAAALALVAAAVAVALWPLHADGVTGNALVPRYGDFGWYSYEPVTAPMTMAQLRRAGVRVPQDAVDKRRRIAAGLVAAAAIAGVASLRAGRRFATAERAG